MFWENFYFLCEKNNVKPLQVVKSLEIAHGNITNWKNGRVPSGKNLQKIADYFGVSVDYLLGNEDQKKEEPLQKLYTLDQNGIHMVPLFEDVSAGFGVLAENNVVDYIPLYFKSPIEADNTICIRVRGDSMYPKIEDGDVIQVHKQTSVDSGSIAVVLLDGAAGLVKKVEYGPDWIVLHSINPMYQPMRFEGADILRVKVLGLVKKIIKEV